MSQFAVEEGADAQLSQTLDGLFGVNFLAMFLYAGSASFSSSTTLASLVPQWFFSGNLVNPGLLDWTLANGVSDVTATLSDQTFNVSGTGGALTFDGWCIAASEPSFARPSHALLWCGSISPTYTPPNGGGLSYVLSGLTVTLGQCATSGPTTVVLDNMIDADHTPIASHMPQIGGPWTQGDGLIEILSDAATSVSPQNNGCQIDCGHSDMSISMTFIYGTGSSIGMYFRWIDPNNYEEFFDFAGGVYLYHVVSGTATVISGPPISLTGGDTYTFTITARGSQTYWTGPNGLLFGISDSSVNLTGTFAGIRIYDNPTPPTAVVTEFKVVTL